MYLQESYPHGHPGHNQQVVLQPLLPCRQAAHLVDNFMHVARLPNEINHAKIKIVQNKTSNK